MSEQTLYIDTHTHLYEPDYGTESDQAVERAVQAGVVKLILPDVDSRSREAMFSLASRHPGVTFPSLGLHPTDVNEAWRDELDALMAEKNRPAIVAIGEIGMDFHTTKEFAKQQEEVFRILLDLALQMSLPVIIHNRESTETTLNILNDYRGRGLRGVFHAYGGSYETFREIEKCGDFYVGIGGVITFKKASIAETIKQIPLEYILSETDAPWLTPVPYRGKRNESAYIPYIIEKIALQKELDPAQVAHVTWQNAHKLFNI